MGLTGCGKLFRRPSDPYRIRIMAGKRMRRKLCMVIRWILRRFEIHNK